MSVSEAGKPADARRALLEAALRRRRSQRAERNRIVAAPREGRLPCTYQQESLWILHQLDPTSSVYNVAIPLRFRGADVQALAEALGGLVARHEGLRTRFDGAGGAPAQVIDEAPRRWPLPVVELPDEAALVKWVDEQGNLPFDLSAGPLFRTPLARLGTDDHTLLLVWHHTITDGWSAGLMLSELALRYDAALRTTPAGERARAALRDLPELTVQPVDYAVWQRNWLTGPQREQELDYWRQRLAGLEPLEFPSDRPRPAQPTGAGEILTRRLPDGLAEPAHALSRSEGVSFLAVLCAAFLVLLNRYTGQRDLAVGSVLSGRSRSEIEPLVGLFANTVVLRTNLDGEPTFRELVHRCNDTVLGATAHQDTPFSLVVDTLNPERVAGRNPLFQICFTHQGTAVTSAGLRLGDSEVSRVAQQAQYSRFDLGVYINEAADGLDLVVEYSTELFDADRIERLVTHFGTVLADGLADPGRSISQLRMLTAAEYDRLLRAANPTPVARDTDGALLQDVVARSVADDPGKVAVRHEGTDLTYRELDAWSNQLSHRLVADPLSASGTAAAVAPRGVVGILLTGGPGLPVSQLAVLKAGAAWLPLDPLLPRERLAYQIRDAGARAVITTADLADLLPADLPRILLGPRPPADAPTTAPVPVGHPDDIAYLIYTSGSTGQPKGVMVPHRAVVSFCANAIEEYGITAADRVTQVGNPGFDVSLFEIYAPLIAGATVVAGDRTILQEPQRFVALLREERVTVSYGPPAVLSVLDPPPQLPDLRLLLFAGEAFPAELVNRWARPGLQIHNGYGPTEVTVICVGHRFGPQRLDTPPPLGRPFPNHRAYVLDTALQPVPTGVPGQLYLAGSGLARGYLGRPELTAEKYLPDPFTDRPGERMYASGDIVRRRSDGDLEYLGRVDRQVKLRGLRIELGEIEHALVCHPDVRQAAVVLRESGTPRAYLAAYLVPQPGQQVEEASLRRDLVARLPLALVPTSMTVLSELPVTPNGKLDHARLPSPTVSSADSRVAPRTDTERVLAEVWGQLLGIDIADIGVHDQFFAIGGNSLQATQLMSRIRDRFAVTVEVRQLFEQPALEQLATVIDAAARDLVSSLDDNAGAGDGVIATQRQRGDIRVVPIPRSGPLRCSQQQEGLWFLAQLDPRSTVYHMPMALRLRGELAVPALGEALRCLVARHESLRTRFVAELGVPTQVVDLPPATRPLAAVAVTPDEAQRLVAAEAARPFDLAADPALRTALYRIGPDDHVLLLVVHHINSDGWSMGRMTAELAELYDAARHGREPVLPELRVQPVDHAAWQRRLLTGDTLDRQLGYWRDALAGVEPLNFPTDRPRPAVSTGAGAVLQRRLPPAVTAAMRDLVSERHMSLLAVLLAGFAAVLGRYTGQRDVTVGSVFSGRSRSELEPMLGFLANTLVLRTDLTGDPTFGDLVDRCHDTVLGALAHQDVPFGTVVDDLKPQREAGRNPLFQVSLTLQPAAVTGDGARFGDTRIEPWSTGDTGQARFDIAVAAVDDPDGQLDLVIEYSTELFDQSRIDAMVDHLSAVLAQGTARPGTRISGLELLTASEMATISDWSRARRPHLVDAATDVSLWDLFAAQVGRQPDAVAVVAGERQLTYRELDASAGQVAARLADLGVEVGDLVGLCCPRGAELVSGTLGILRAGAAYVPFDPDQPAARMAFTLADSGVAVILTGAGVTLPAGTYTTVRLDDPHSPPLPVPPPAAVTGADLAYLIYTSGSTGKPKAVMVAHRNVVRLLRATEEWFHFDENDVWTLLHPAAFDVSVWELWGALAHGGRLVVVPYWHSRTPDLFYDLLIQEQVTVLNQTPAAFGQLVTVDAARGADLAVRTIIMAGDALDRDAVLRWFDRHEEDRPRLVNMYGITETTVHVTYQPLSRAVLTAGRSPIGVPIGDLAVRVVDAAGHLTPVGVAGELWVAGPGVAYGYLGRPALTAERFGPGDAGDGAADRFYRSGDLARWRADGTLDYLGRADRQVQVRGFRVELGEIEAALAGAPGVSAALAAVHGDATNPRIVGYVVQDPAGYDEAAVRDHVAQRLPGYMVPALLVRLDAIPLTGNGKVDRAALPTTAGTDGRTYVAPRTPTEVTLARIWADVLPVERVGTTDSFFELGGNSLDLVRVSAAIRRECAVTLDTRSLYAAPTVTAMAALLAGADSSAAASPVVPLTTTGDRPPLFLVHAVGGSAAPYVRLASLLGADQPCYGLEDPALHGDPPTSTLPELARRYVAALRRRRPAGPYRLGGWSLGGVVALEMARQLLAEGDKVAPVVLIDSGLSAEPSELTEADVLTWFVRDLASIAGMPPPALDLSAGMEPDGGRVDAVLTAVVEAGLVAAELREELRARIAAFSGNVRAFLAHQPEPYEGSLVYLKAVERPGDEPQRWRALARGGFTEVPLPGDHYTMLQPPHLTVLADALRNCLDKAGEDGC